MVLTYNILVCSSLQRSNALTTNQEHLKSSISVPICIIKNQYAEPSEYIHISLRNQVLARVKPCQASRDQQNNPDNHPTQKNDYQHPNTTYHIAPHEYLTAIYLHLEVDSHVNKNILHINMVFQIFARHKQRTSNLNRKTRLVTGSTIAMMETKGIT